MNATHGIRGETNCADTQRHEMPTDNSRRAAMITPEYNIAQCVECGAITQVTRSSSECKLQVTWHSRNTPGRHSN